jgi:BASS family bile acid:Na+ symporter
MENLELLFNIAILIFVVTTMLSMGLGLRFSEIIKPLKDIKLIAITLMSNFVLIPFATLGVLSLIPLDKGTHIALILLSLAAGAPFIPKLVEIAKGDKALGTAIMLLLMVATVVILPFALPLFIGADVAVDSLSIAKSLVIMMIIPLVIALIIKAKADSFAQRYQPIMVKLSNIALLAIIVIMSILHGKAIIGIIGYDMVAIVLFMFISLAIGYAISLKESSSKVVSSLAAGQRNISAALVVAAQNFANDPKVGIVIIAVSVIGLFILLFSAKQYQKKSIKG